MPKHYDAEVKARAVRLVAEHIVGSGSMTMSCEAVGPTPREQQGDLTGMVTEILRAATTFRGELDPGNR
jgi:hypothetical protein